MRFGHIFIFSLIFFNLFINITFAAEAAIANNLRYSSNDERLRVVVDVSENVAVKEMMLSNPARLVVDIKNAVLSKDAKRDIDLKSKFGSHIKIAQYDAKTVRVVINILNSHHKVWTMKNPDRVVIDVGDGNSAVKNQTPKTEPRNEQQNKPKREDKATNSNTSKDNDKKNDSNISDNKKTDENKNDNKRNEEKRKEKNTDVNNISDNDIDRELAQITGLKHKKIAIDPGHGGSDVGAVGPTGAYEKNVTLDICLELKEILEEDGAEVIMTRETDKEVSPKKANATAVEELQARVDIANRAKADIFLSIHMDSFTNRTARGTTGYYYGGGSAVSRTLADKVRANIVDQLGTMSRGTQTCNFYVVKHTDMPATLIEVAFISHPDEERLLTSKEGVRKAATAIADGISDYFG